MCSTPRPSRSWVPSVNGKPTFLNISHVGILNASAPHLISLSMSKSHYTNAGIKELGTFSVNILSADQVVQADYVGMVSGWTTAQVVGVRGVLRGARNRAHDSRLPSRWSAGCTTSTTSRPTTS